MAATVAQFRALIPAFTLALVGDGTVEAYLGTALASMKGGLGDAADQAQVFLAAHLMSLAGIGPRSQAGELAGFTTIKAGSLTLSRSERAAAGDLAATPYGSIYWQIAYGKRDPSFLVTGTGELVFGLPGSMYDLRHGHGEG